MSNYQGAIKNGTIGSKKDFSWDGKTHSCCNSKAWWKHKNTCLQVIGTEDEIGNEKWKALKFMDKNTYINEVFA